MGFILVQCDHDCDQTLCERDIHFCKKPDILKDYLFGTNGEGRRIGMEKKNHCHLFRSPGDTGENKGESYCDIDSSRTACEGDVSFCEKPDAFREYFRKRLDEYRKREGTKK